MVEKTAKDHLPATMAEILLVDGHNLAFRSFYGTPQLTRKDGFPLNAIYGWLKGLWRLQDRIQPEKTIVFFDLGHSSSRREMLQEYKAQRPPAPDGFRCQMPFIKRLTGFLGIQTIEQQNVEADDLLASFAVQAAPGVTVAIASADKDFAQIVSDRIHQWLPPTSGQDWRELDPTGVIEKFGVKASQIVDYLSLMGDAADNIDGVPGVGAKTAARWLKDFESIEGILGNVARLPVRFRDTLLALESRLRRNQRLIRLDLSLPPPPVDSTAANFDELVRLLRDLQLPSLIRESEKRYRHERNCQLNFFDFSVENKVINN